MVTIVIQPQLLVKQVQLLLQGFSVQLTLKVLLILYSIRLVGPIFRRRMILLFRVVQNMKSVRRLKVLLLLSVKTLRQLNRKPQLLIILPTLFVSQQKVLSANVTLLLVLVTLKVKQLTGRLQVLKLLILHILMEVKLVSCMNLMSVETDISHYTLSMVELVEVVS